MGLFQEKSLEAWVGTAIFFGSGTMISYVTEAMRRAQARTHEAEAQAKILVERQRAHEALQASELRFSTMFRISPLAISISRLRDGQFLDVNEAFLRLHGYSREEIIGHTSNELGLWHSSFRTSFIEELREKKRPLIIDMQGRRKSGEIRDLLVSVELIELGGEQCILGNLTDVTDRKKAEEALKIMAREWQTTFDSVQSAIWLMDRNRNTLRCNKAAAQMLQTEVQGTLELCCKSMHGSSIPAPNCPFVAMLQSGRRETAVMSFGPRWLEVMADPIFDETGGIVGAVHVAVDITNRKQAEEELVASRGQLQALAGRLQAVREEERTHIAREIHDVLAQELTRLKIDLVWLHRRLTKTTEKMEPEALALRVGEMRQIADAAICCVQGIATELRPVVLDTLGLCAAVEWQVREFQGRAKIDCHATVPEEELPLDREVATALFRILQESLTNVLRHAHATRLVVLLCQQAEHVILRVQDNGLGIAPETLNNPLSIGLAGMRERALLLQGQLEIRSRPGAGTVLEVWLPIAHKNSENS